MTPVDYTGRVLPDYSSAEMFDFALFVFAGIVMLLGCVAIPVAVVSSSRRFRAWGAPIAVAVTMLGLLAVLQCAYMAARFYGVAPF